MNRNKLFHIPRPAKKPRLRLFCFPFAGGSASVFQSWPAYFCDEVELVLVQAPGRGARLVEPAHDNMTDLVDELMAHAGFITSLPYVVFGHSLGSRVAFELCNRLAKVQLPLPRFFIGSGSRAPHLASLKKPTYDLPDAEFMQELSELNGTPKEVLHNHELMQLLLPLLRADFKIADTYQAQAVQHPFPIWVFHGEQDVGITADQLQSWTELSSVECTFSYFPGDHFFVMEHSNRVVPQVVAVTQQVLSRLPAGDSVVMV